MVSGPNLTAPLGREREVERIERFLDGVVVGSRTLLLEGEVGIGKTTVMRHAAARAAARGFTVLSAHPVEAEMPLEFAALADVLDGVPSDLLEALPDPQRRAIGVAVRRDEPADSPVDPRTIATAVVTLIRTLADVRPVVLLIDDLPWLDRPSARVFSFVMRRTRATAAGLMVAARTTWSGESTETFVDDLDPDAVDRVRLGPVSVAVLREVLTSRGGPLPPRAHVRRLHEVSRGNPMLALELAAGPDRTDQDGTLPIPASISRLLLLRIAALSSAEREVLLLAALAGDTAASLVRMAAKNSARVDDIIDDLVRAGTLNRSGDRLTFSHPLIRSVVVNDARPTERRSAHRRLAGVAGSSEAAGRHLAFATTGPDERAAAAAEDAARTAGARGGCDVAADLAELAAALTPGPQTLDRHRRLVLAAEYRCDAADPQRASTILTGVIDASEKGPDRAKLLLLLARYLIYRGDPLEAWVAALDAALAEAGDDTPLRAAILTDRSFAATYAGDAALAIGFAESALELTGRSPESAQGAQLCGVLAWTRFLSGDSVRPDLIDRALAGPEQPARVPTELRPNILVGHIRHLTDDLDSARELYELEYARARREGVETALPFILCGLVETEAYAGNWERGEELGNEGCELADESGGLPAIALMAAMRGLVRVCQGRIEEGRRDAERALAAATAVQMPLFMYFAVQSLGLADLSVGDPAAAHRALGRLAEGVRLGGVKEPTLVRFLVDDVEALIRLNNLDAAEQLLDPFEARSRELGRAWGVAAAGRCRALLLAARGELAAAEAAVSTALEVHESLPLPFERARTLLIAGEVHRRARHKRLAGERLHAAIVLFEHLGATLWAERARSELDRIGRPTTTKAAPSELTSAELRVADLVASGLSNPQVAAKLFMAQRTVEAHLSRIYRKLGVQSRTELANSFRRSGTAFT